MSDVDSILPLITNGDCSRADDNNQSKLLPPSPWPVLEAGSESEEDTPVSVMVKRNNPAGFSEAVSNTSVNNFTAC